MLLLWPTCRGGCSGIAGWTVSDKLSLSSESFLLLLLLICGEKGVLKVNRAEERSGTKFS
jgi:hypothetical protein